MAKRKKAKTVGGCRVVKFKGKPEAVKFCAKELSPAKLAAKKERAKKILKAYACSAKRLKDFPALETACRSKKLPSAKVAKAYAEKMAA